MNGSQQGRAHDGAAPRGGARGFTGRGTRNGSLVAVTWVDGHLTGDYSTVDLVETFADLVEASYQDGYLGARLDRPKCPGPRGLHNPVFAYELILRTIDSVRETTGPLSATVVEAVSGGQGSA